MRGVSVGQTSKMFYKISAFQLFCWASIFIFLENRNRRKFDIINRLGFACRNGLPYEQSETC
ncbi:MAG: hypothetical protein PHR14_10510, partial [Oscillospiraceae bacterium]|nr:hypothetical protein [Oscillospiraceae bacterium]